MAKNSAIGGMGGSMRDSNSGTDDPHGDESRPTIVLKTEVFEAEVDPILELLGRWEEYRRRGEEPPADWTRAIDPAMREELDRRIERREASDGAARAGECGRPQATGPDESLPSFPGHETLGRIGRGGMGVVYKARDRKLQRIVAIKTIAEGRFATPDQRERFRVRGPGRRPAAPPEYHRDPRDRRARQIGRTWSSNSPKGASLAAPAAPRRRWSREAAELVETLARAVHAAHQAGVVHRDLKPSNILLTAEGHPQGQRLRPGQAAGRRLPAGRSPARCWARPATWRPSRPKGTPNQVGTGRRHLRPRGDPLPGADRPAAVPGRIAARDPQAGRLQRGRAPAPAPARRPARPGDDLPEMPGEGALRGDTPRALALADDLDRSPHGRPILGRPHRRRSTSGDGVAAIPGWPRRPSPPRPSPPSSHRRGRIGRDLPRPARPDRGRPAPDRAPEAETRKDAIGPSRPTARPSPTCSTPGTGGERPAIEAEMQAVLEFLQNKVLAAARPKDQEGGLGRDVSLRVALDTAEAGISQRIRGQPAVEASIRDRARRDLLLPRRAGAVAPPDRARLRAAAPGPRARPSRHAAIGRRPGPCPPRCRPARRGGVPPHRDLASPAGQARTRPRRYADLEAQPRHGVPERGPDGRGPAYSTRRRSGAAGRLWAAATPDTLFSMNNLASAYREPADSPTRCRSTRRRLKRRRAMLGPDHPDTLISMNNLANFYREAGPALRIDRTPVRGDAATGGDARSRPSRHVALDEQPRPGLPGLRPARRSRAPLRGSPRSAARPSWAPIIPRLSSR